MYKAFIENKGDSKNYATMRHSGLVLDAEGKGANPVDMLLASFCGCMGHYLRNYMVSRKIVQNGFYIEAEAGFTADKTCLAGINVRIDLKDIKLSNTQETEMLTFLENCPVHKILKTNPGVAISFISP